MKTIKDLDRTDRKILRVLQTDGRIANVDLARTVNLTPTPCLERVRRLESEGFITGYVALLDPVKANAALCAYIEVQLVSTTTEAIRRFNQEMLSLEEVQVLPHSEHAREAPEVGVVGVGGVQGGPSVAGKAALNIHGHGQPEDWSCRLQ